MQNRGLLLFATVLLVAAAFYAADVKLPPPYATPSANNGPHVIPQPEGAQLHVPTGFSVGVYAENFEVPRYMLLGPSGELLLTDAADSPNGTVYAMPLNEADGYKAGERKKLITGLNRPYGLAFWHEYLYVGEPESIKRYKYDAKAMTAGPGEEVISLKGFGHGHWTRSLLFDRAGQKLYVGVGSGSNVSPGEDPVRAAINRYNPDGSGHETYAAGTRNPIGLHWYPATDTLWAAVQERDALGDDLVPDYFTHIQQGGFYGWPYAYIGPNEDPRNKGQKPDLVAKTIVPDLPLMPAHQAVLDFEFYTARQFPAEYREGAFLALHGSWNRAQRVGYKIAFVPFHDGKPAGPERDFLTGWMIAPDSRDVWGRPVGLSILPDGSMLISDDGGKKIWRVTYKH
ncbi:MAG: PQQ-dependent sugar dehydrogenase [Bryobacteraceae bacterium]|jgi:glucose/arabinose dehydrogenase